MSRSAASRAVSPRVAEALDYLCRGQTRKQIARAMGVSEHTVKNWLSIGYQQLGCENSAGAAVVWSQLRHPEAFGLLCARCGLPAAEEDRLLAAGCFE